MITINAERCNYCASEFSILTDFNSGQVACSNCGVVLDDRVIDESSEWRNFQGENIVGGNSDPNRVGGPINPYLNDNDLTTNIATNHHSGTLSRYKNRSLGSGNRSLIRGFRKLEDLAFKLDLHTSIIEKSKDTLKKIEESKKLKGRSIDAVLAAIFFYSCRQCNAPKTIKDIIHTLNLNKKEVSRCYNFIKKSIFSNNDLPISNNTTGLVTNYCNKLEMPNSIKKAALDIAETVCKLEIIAGRNPSSVATSSILFAIKLLDCTKIGKTEIAEVSKTTENTISSAFNKLLEYKQDICPKYLLSNIHKLNC
jgi:transcription initiation factor TFIIB